MTELQLSKAEKEEIIATVQGQMIIDYGAFPCMDAERRDNFYLFLGILRASLKNVPEKLTGRSEK